MVDVFREVRERVSAQDAARRYGLQFDRRGWAVCPFHNDHKPSMSFRNGRYRCWACNASGDSIDFTSKLLGLEPMAAVERLNADFMLGLPLHRKPTESENREARRRQEVAEAYKAFETWRANCLRKLTTAIREGNMALKNLTNLDELSERDARAIRDRDALEYYADTLANGTPEDQAAVYRERQVIDRWTSRILNG